VLKNQYRTSLENMCNEPLIMKAVKLLGDVESISIITVQNHASFIFVWNNIISHTSEQFVNM